MSTKSAQGGRHQGQVPFQARRKVIVVTVIILLIATAAWIVAYTRATALTPIGAPAAPIAPVDVAPAPGAGTASGTAQ